MIVFQVFIKFWSSEKNTENTTSHLYFNEDNDYSEGNTCNNEVFRSTILHHRKKLCEKKLCEKRCSLKFRKIHNKHLCQKKHLWTLNISPSSFYGYLPNL